MAKGRPGPLVRNNARRIIFGTVQSNRFGSICDGVSATGHAPSKGSFEEDNRTPFQNALHHRIRPPNTVCATVTGARGTASPSC
jgi:hypothetical protein